MCSLGEGVGVAAFKYCVNVCVCMCFAFSEQVRLAESSCAASSEAQHGKTVPL